MEGLILAAQLASINHQPHRPALAVFVGYFEQVQALFKGRLQVETGGDGLRFPHPALEQPSACFKDLRRERTSRFHCGFDKNWLAGLDWVGRNHDREVIRINGTGRVLDVSRIR